MKRRRFDSLSVTRSNQTQIQPNINSLSCTGQHLHLLTVSDPTDMRSVRRNWCHFWRRWASTQRKTFTSCRALGWRGPTWRSRQICAPGTRKSSQQGTVDTWMLLSVHPADCLYALHNYRGLPFIPHLDSLPNFNRSSDGPVRLPIVDKYKVRVRF